MGFDAARIVADITAFVQMIHTKFPKTIIYNSSIKPSFERRNEAVEIQKINAGLPVLATALPYLHQRALYEQLMDGENIKKDMLLQDGLRLNQQGYDILKKARFKGVRSTEIAQ